MKSLLAFLVFSLLLSITSCSWFNEEEDEPRKTSCIQPGLYDYLERDGPVSICTTEVCSFYTEVWKELFIKQNNMTEEYFGEHITVIRSSIYGNDGQGFSVDYRVQNDWAIAEASWDRFVIKISEDDDDYPEIGLPKGIYLTLEQIEALLDNRGFNSKINKAPKTGPLRYSTMSEALDSLINAAKVDTMCFRRIFLNLHPGTLTLEASAVYENEANSCIEGTIDLITGRKYFNNVSCE